MSSLADSAPYSQSRPDAFELAKAVDPEKLCNYLGFELEGPDSDRRGACRIHGGSNRTSFSLNRSNPQEVVWCCHSCGAGGGLVELWRDAHELPQTREGNLEAARGLAEWDNSGCLDAPGGPANATRSPRPADGSNAAEPAPEPEPATWEAAREPTDADRDFWRSRLIPGPYELERAYAIRDRDGRLFGHHLRILKPPTEPDGKPRKSFQWWRNGKRSLGGLSSFDAPFFLSERIPEFDPVEPVVIVEGEKAAEALALCEIQALATVTGAGKKKSLAPAVLATLKGFRVVLWPDQDDTGRDHMAALSKAMAAARLDRPLIFDPGMDLGKGGDAFEWTGGFAEGEPKDRFAERLAELETEAEMAAPEKAEGSDAEDANAEDLEKAAALFAAAPRHWQKLPEKDPNALPIARFLVYPEELTIFAANTKQGKTTITAQAAAAVSAGLEFGGAPTLPGRVLWFTEEPVAFTRRRMEAYPFEPGELEVFNLNTLSLEAATAGFDDASQAIGALVRLRCPRLVVVDTLSIWAEQVLTGDFSQAKGWLKLFGPLRSAMEATGAGAILLHHTNAAGVMRDSKAVKGACDLAIEPMKASNRPGGRFRATSRMRTAEPFRLVGFDEGTRMSRIEGLAASPGGDASEDSQDGAEASTRGRIRDEILEQVGASPGITATDLRSKVSGKGAWVHEERQWLLSEGAIVATQVGKATKFYLPGAANTVPEASE